MFYSFIGEKESVVGGKAKWHFWVLNMFSVLFMEKKKEKIKTITSFAKGLSVGSLPFIWNLLDCFCPHGTMPTDTSFPVPSI